MTDVYFYSKNLDECAACGAHIGNTRGIGAAALEAPGKPLMHYTLCDPCMGRLMAQEAGFLQHLEKRIVDRAHAIGAIPSAAAPAMESLK